MEQNYLSQYLRSIILGICLLGFSSLSAQTLMPLPAHASVYTGNVRGYWFTAPVNFTITGLKVAQQAGTGLQYIHVFKINDATPVVFPTTSTNFTTLAYITGAANNVVQTVSINVTAGDKIGILGGVGSGTSIANSYGGTSTTLTTNIGGNTVQLARLLYQGTIFSAGAPNYCTEPTSSNISRVEMYYITGPVCPLPTGVAASGITMTSANFNWSAVVGSQGYEYAITTTSAAPSSGTVTTGTSYSATNLNNGTSYWFHVRNQCSTAYYSNWVTLPFNTVACPAVTGLAASSVTTISASINWNAVSGTNGYEYALSTSATPPSSGAVQTTTSYNATGLTPGTTYYFHVRNQCTSPSNSVWTTISFPTAPCPSAGAPGLVTNVPGTVTFSWPGTTTPGVASYQYAVTGSASAPATWTATGNTTATVPGLTPGTTYYAHVRSSCNGTNSAWQNIQFLNPFPPCYAPASMTIGNINMHGANIAWNASTGTSPQGYQYAVTTSAAPPASGTVTPDTFYAATGLIGNTKYYAHVRTHCGSTNYSPWTTDSFLTSATCLASNMPTIANVTANSADISWDAFPGIYGYEYFINTTASAPTYAGMAINYNVIAPINLNSGTTYYFHLRTRCDTFNYSPWTSTPFTTLTVCSATSTPSLSNITPTEASFNWTAVPNAQSYEYGVTGSGTPPASTGLFSSTPNVTVMSLLPGTPYFFHVRAYCSGSDISEWKTMAFSTAQTSVGAMNTSADFSINAYPNPVGDILHIALTGKMSGRGSVLLYDLSGKLIRQMDMNSDRAELNMNGLAQGMYLLRYMDEEHTGTMRIQKQ